MINGVDVLIRTQAGAITLEVAVRAIRQRWTNAIFENGTTGEEYPTFWQIPFGDLDELFVYRDSHASQLWNDQGAVPETHNLMIHLLRDQDQLVVVIDSEDDVMQTIIAAVRSALDDRQFLISYMREAA